jgi:hypothetical protein
LRLPKRARGLVLGLITLVAGPVVAVALTNSTQASLPALSGASAARVPLGAIDRVARDVPEPLLLRAREPIPPPTPTPAPTLAPAPAPPRHRVSIPTQSYSAGSVAGIIYAAAARWGVSGAWMVSIAQCESGLNPRSLNPRGPYYGLFQFLMSTFVHNGGTNIWDPADQANIAAKMLAHGQAWQWACA